MIVQLPVNCEDHDDRTLPSLGLERVDGPVIKKNGGMLEEVLIVPVVGRV